MDYLLIISSVLLINGILYLIISSLLKKGTLGIWGVSFLFILLSPIIGLMFRRYSKREIKRVQRRPDLSFEREEHLLKQIDELITKEELGLLDEEGKQQLEQLKRDYNSMSSKTHIIIPSDY